MEKKKPGKDYSYFPIVQMCETEREKFELLPVKSRFAVGISYGPRLAPRKLNNAVKRFRSCRYSPFDKKGSKGFFFSFSSAALECSGGLLLKAQILPVMYSEAVRTRCRHRMSVQF